MHSYSRARSTAIFTMSHFFYTQTEQLLWPGFCFCRFRFCK